MRGWRLVFPWLGAAAFVAAALAWLGEERRDEKALESGSVFNTSAEGTSLAHAYLRERGRGVRILTRPLGPDSAGDGVLLRVRPTKLPFRRRGTSGVAAGVLTPREEAWIRGGGRLVLALEASYGGITLKPADNRDPVRKVFPAWPRVRSLAVDSGRVLAETGLPGAGAIFARGDTPVLVRAPLGRGDVVVLAVPRALDNAHLGQGDHLELLQALVGKGRVVYFDEYVHGLRTETGVFELLAGWGFGPALISLGLLGAAAFWRGRSRLGPADPDPAETRSEAVDLVDSLAQLYDRTIRREEAVRLYLDSLRRSAALRTGLRGKALEGRVKSLLGGFNLPRVRGQRDLDPAAFQSALRSINEGFRRLEEHAQPR
jgi:hypothetical protein